MGPLASKPCVAALLRYLRSTGQVVGFRFNVPTNVHVTVEAQNLDLINSRLNCVLSVGEAISDQWPQSECRVHSPSKQVKPGGRLPSQRSAVSVQS